MEHGHRSVMRSDAALDLTSDFWMHRHFRAMAEVYHSLLVQAEFLPGDRVLDVGCGSGTHLAWLAAIIGSEGSIVGVDTDPENLELAQQRISRAAWRGQVTLRQAELTRLPFPDATFDAIWCAGSLQYEPDPVAAIREMARVVRPGGRIACQDVEMHPMMLAPLPDELVIALKGCLPRGETADGVVDWFVGHKLRGYLLQAGLREVRGLLRMREYVHPLTEDERGFLEVAIPYLCTASPGIVDLTSEQRAHLQRVSNPTDPTSLFGQPDFLFLEGRAMAVGVR